MNVALILPHLSSSQVRDEIFFTVGSNIAKTNNSFSLFFENASPCYSSAPMSMMNISEFRYFSGRAITFSLKEAHYPLSSFNKIEPVLYAYDLDWLDGETDFIKNVEIYRNPSLALYTRSESYADMIEKYSGRRPLVKTLEEVLLSE